LWALHECGWCGCTEDARVPGTAEKGSVDAAAQAKAYTAM
jgi:hypothetical protein